MIGSVVISGAGIAGPVMGSLLARRGVQVTVVEAADGVRTGGQAVDLRGAGRTVLARMGLLERAKASSLAQEGIADVDSAGRHLSEMTVRDVEGDFVRPLGGYTARFTAPEGESLHGWHAMYNEPGLVASLRPGRESGTANAGADPVRRPHAPLRRDRTEAATRWHPRLRAGRPDRDPAANLIHPADGQPAPPRACAPPPLLQSRRRHPAGVCGGATEFHIMRGKPHHV